MNSDAHRRALDALPDKKHEADLYGYSVSPWTPPEGDVLLERNESPAEDFESTGRVTISLHTNVRWSVIHHSPTGLEWGYAGSGPADLALNILNMFVPPGLDGMDPVDCYEGRASATAWELHQQFKRAVIQGAPREGGIIPGEKIAAWIAKHSHTVRG